MRRLLSVLLASAALATPAVASACESADDGRAVIHSAVPNPIPQGAVVARVTFLSTDERALFSTGVRARVDRRIHGSVPGSEIIVRAGDYGSCSHSFTNGSSGILVGMPERVDNGRLVVRAIEVRRGDGYRIRR